MGAAFPFRYVTGRLCVQHLGEFGQPILTLRQPESVRLRAGSSTLKSLVLCYNDAHKLGLERIGRQMFEASFNATGAEYRLGMEPQAR